VGYAQFAQAMIKAASCCPYSSPSVAHDSCLKLTSWPIVRGNCLRITFEFAGLIGGELVLVSTGVASAAPLADEGERFALAALGRVGRTPGSLLAVC
jgi:hypothetical protein